MRVQQPASKRSWRVARFPIASLVAAAAMVAAASVGSAASGWVVVNSPNGGVLVSVSCLSSTSCMGVGEQPYTSEYIETFAAAWNGSVWSEKVVPRRGNDSFLHSVSCISSRFCMAVGSYDVVGEPTEGRTLAETWNGTAWSFVASPNKTTVDSALTGVSCISSTFCVAVGYYSYSPSNSALALVEMWNGSAWSVAAAPPRSNTSILDDVSCTSAASCVAVGGYEDYSSYVFKTLVERWNGAKWSIVASPNPVNDSQLNGVSCSSSTRCAAVGEIEEGSSATQTLAETWNGSAWSIVASPSQGTYSGLASVSCVSSTACVAVGWEGASPTPTAPEVTLVETWNGAVWSVTTSPQFQRSFSGVSWSGLTSCMAVTDGYVETGPA
jgi:hypothetical protein